MQENGATPLQSLLRIQRRTTIAERGLHFAPEHVHYKAFSLCKDMLRFELLGNASSSWEPELQSLTEGGHTVGSRRVLCCPERQSKHPAPQLLHCDQN